MNLKDKTVLVTGGLGLLGKSIVESIEKNGGVALASTRSSEKAEEFSKIAESTGMKARAVVLDMSSEESLLNTLRKVCERYPKVHCLVNNAFAHVPYFSVEETNWSHWQKAMDVNVAAAHTLAVRLKNAGSLQSVANISSMFSLRAPDFTTYPENMEPNPVIYGPSKAALNSLTRYLAAYWGDKGIRVNSVSPGGIANSQNSKFLEKYNQSVPMQRMVTPEEVAEAVVFLISKAASGITGQNIVIDGGRTIW